ncbi:MULTISPECIES: GNAT family N-acetyltransferase [unclassified Anabaena]|uniref:GNAT family N-acetyltransferase n=1 Tax=unclassified Anabaena TaxID=2619674 RepID=UPI0039C5BE5E
MGKIPCVETVKSYQLTLIDTTNASVYEEFTYPHFRSLLQNLTPDVPVVGIGVELEGNPIGLALARYSPQVYGQILSLFVVPTHRSQGVGTALMARMETELQHRGCTEMEINYLTSSNSPALEGILSHQKWSTPKATALVCYASTDRVEQTKQSHLTQYLDRLLTNLPADYSLFPWNTLTNKEREEIAQQVETDALVRRFNPFSEEKKLEPLNSLGLRYQNQVVGWIITHRTAPDAIRYTQMFVNPKSQPLSRSTLLLARAIQLQVENLPHTKGTFRVDIDNTPMVKFVHRRLKPYLDEIRYAWSATKVLS